MEAEGIYLKKVDRKMYRKLKAVAAERGVPVYRMVNDAIRAYIESTQSEAPRGSLVSQNQLDNAAFRSIESERSLQGRWVGIAGGKLLGTAENAEAAVGLVRQAYSKNAFRHGIIARVGEAREEREWLAGSLQKV